MRPATLPAAISPVLIGFGVACGIGDPHWDRGALTLLVALALQVGANFSNDYSDGVRGADKSRKGPARLTASGAATPRAVRAVAFLSFAIAALAGATVSWMSGNWWLIAVGAAAIGAAWFYTGGPRPYGYAGLGEIGVFIFFGPVAVVGTAYVQHGELPWVAWCAGAGVGLLACAILMANNLRDLPTDRKAGKRTLAVGLGDRRARRVFTLEVLLAFVCALACSFATIRALAAIVLLPPTIRVIGAVGRGVRGLDLIAVLRRTGQIELGYGILLGLAFAFA